MTESRQPEQRPAIFSHDSADFHFFKRTALRFFPDWDGSLFDGQEYVCDLSMRPGITVILRKTKIAPRGNYSWSIKQKRLGVRSATNPVSELAQIVLMLMLILSSVANMENGIS